MFQLKAFPTYASRPGPGPALDVLWAREQLIPRIRESLRQGDVVGRLGGDELVVLLPAIHSLDDAVLIAEQIRSCVAEPIYHDEHTIHPTVSIGATTAEPGESASTVIARADVAMYQAKEAGRNVVTRIEATVIDLGRRLSR